MLLGLEVDMQVVWRFEKEVDVLRRRWNCAFEV